MFWPGAGKQFSSYYPPPLNVSTLGPTPPRSIERVRMHCHVSKPRFAVAGIRKRKCDRDKSSLIAAAASSHGIVTLCYLDYAHGIM